MSGNDDAQEHERIKTASAAEWTPLINRWKGKWRRYGRSNLGILVVATLLIMASAVLTTISVAQPARNEAKEPQVVWWKELGTWASIGGIVAASLSTLSNALQVREKAAFYKTVAEEGDILLNDLQTEAQNYENVVALRTMFETVRRTAAAGVAGGQGGTEAIKAMAKELAVTTTPSSKRR